MTYPLNAPPAWYTIPTPSKPFGVYFPGDVVSFTLSQAGANAYTVRDFTGAIVSSGAVAGTALSPASPVGGWKKGWYRLYLSGPSNDATFGHAYGVTNFCVVTSDSRMPAVALGPAGYLLRPWGQTKAAMGLGTHRYEFPNPADLTAPAEQSWAEIQAAAADASAYWNVNASSPYFDNVRTRYQWAAFTGYGFDNLTNNGAHFFMCKDETVDGSTVSITITAGTSSGQKIVVQQGATTETYDNLADGSHAIAAINGTSALIVCLTAFLTVPFANMTKTFIGRNVWNNIGTIVSTLYPLGVTRFEGPLNEPPIYDPLWVPVFVQGMKLFQAAVHAGNSDAKAIGPCPVTMDGPGAPRWDLWHAQGGFNYCDEISFHAYNAPPVGDISNGTRSLAEFNALLSGWGITKRLWQTESSWGFGNTYGVYHPRGTAATLRYQFIFEQAGIPRERNTYWYDVSHGFWNVPAWWINGDQMHLEPQAPLMRTLAIETFGKSHGQIVDFGPLGNHLMLGSVYFDFTGANSTLACIARGYVAGLSATFKTRGPATYLTLVDGWGNESTVTVAGGHFTILMDTETPRYVRLPNGQTILSASLNDWPDDINSLDYLTRYGHTVTAPDVTTNKTAIDNLAFNNSYPHNSVPGAPDQATLGTVLPANVTMSFDTPISFDAVLVWSGLVFQLDSALLAFKVQTSNDGNTWTDRAAVDATAYATSFAWASDTNDQGCLRETFWAQQSFHEVRFSNGPVRAKYLRVVVTAVSSGGEPDAACVAGIGQGVSPGLITIEQIVPVCIDSAKKRIAFQQSS